MKIVTVFALFFVAAACNPFAPELDESPAENPFGDPHTVDGFFMAFRSAYQFKDTSLYGKLFAADFTFSYRNFDRGLDLEWGRDEEMRATGSLFASALALDLQWGNILDASGGGDSDIVCDITRSFALTITLNLGEILNVDGRAIFHLERPSRTDPWQAVRWRDESNF